LVISSWFLPFGIRHSGFVISVQPFPICVSPDTAQKLEKSAHPKTHFLHEEREARKFFSAGYADARGFDPYLLTTDEHLCALIIFNREWTLIDANGCCNPRNSALSALSAGKIRADPLAAISVD
jgi:hypothetical protein